MQYTVPKYPRVLVSGKRHKSLAAEALRKGMTIEQLAEQKFKATDAKKKPAPGRAIRGDKG